MKLPAATCKKHSDVDSTDYGLESCKDCQIALWKNGYWDFVDALNRAWTLLEPSMETSTVRARCVVAFEIVDAAMGRHGASGDQTKRSLYKKDERRLARISGQNKKRRDAALKALHDAIDFLEIER